jgi:hypothetical protein
MDCFHGQRKGLPLQRLTKSVILFFLVVLNIRAYAPMPETPISESCHIVPVEISIDALALELRQQGLAHWRVVLSQAVLESGWDLNSNVFRNSNNFVGMRVPAARPSTRIGEYNGYSSYDSWQDCVADVKLWQEQNWDGGTCEAYVAKLSRIWAEAPDYGANLHNLVGRFEKQFPAIDDAL